jgi:hypothetical protein
MGPIEQNIIRQAKREGQPIPERIANAPKLQNHQRLYFEAYMDLDSERSHNAGLTAIPWSSIKDYGMFHGLNREQTEDLIYIVRHMDNHYLARLKAKNG